MRIVPDMHLRIANSEKVRISLDCDCDLEHVKLNPRFGENVRIDLEEDGSFDFPRFAAPDTVVIEWYEKKAKDPVFENTVDVVSRHYFTLEALRDYGDDRDDFDDLPEEALFMARQAATEVFERNAGRSFVHLIGRTKDFGFDDLIQLEHGDVYELLSHGYQQVSDCQLVRLSNHCIPMPNWIEYLYGADSVPAEVSRAVLELAAYSLRPSNRPIGASGESTDAGYIHFTIAGRDGATSIPEVNAAIEQFGRGRQYAW